MKSIILGVSVFLSTLCLSSALPESSHREYLTNKDLSMTKQRYNKLIDKVALAYTPILKLHGADEFNIIRDWDNAKVNASTRKRNGAFEMVVYGGLARFEPLSDDGLLLVLCHEIGHFIGGAPTYKPRNDASSEGQADYFSSAKCLKKLYHNQEIDLFALRNLHPLVLSECARSYKLGSHAYKVCLKTSKAIESLAETVAKLSSLDSVPQFDTPDPYERMFILFNGYPSAQCRIDTVFAGSLCPIGHEETHDQTLYNKSNCSRIKGDELGLRPLCWYVPRSD